jgi:DNA primase
MLTLSDAVDKLRAEGLIGRDLQNFKFNGKRAMFSCPFHHDEHPSANLFEGDNGVIFHCFGCNKTMSFDRFLSELPGRESKEKGFSEESKERKFSNGYKFDLTEFAEGLHGRFLLLLEGGKDLRFEDEPRLAQEALKYLQGRGFDLEDIRRYKIGFFYGGLREHKEIEGMEELVKKNSWIKGGECFLTFPIYDKDFSKVLNMQFEDFLGRGVKTITKFNLDGLNVSFWYSKKFDKSYSWVITEGIYDAMSMAKGGWLAIATLGNPLTQDKIKQLKELDEVILCFDNDEAGRKYRDEIIKELSLTKVRMYEFNLPEKDPNEVLVKHGVGAIEKLEPVEIIPFPAWDKKIEFIIKRYEDSMKKAVPIPDEFEYLQNIFPNGFLPGLYAIAGLPGVGKTTFLNLLCNELAKKGVLSIYLLSEEPEYVLLARTKIKEGLKSIKDLAKLDFLKYRITIEMNLELRAENLKEITEGIIRRADTSQIILVVDSLQALRLSEEREGKMSIREKTLLKTEYLSHIARDLQIPVFFTSFISREFYDKESPTLSIFKESGDIEYLIDVGMALWLENDNTGGGNNTKKKVSLKTLKNRFGKVGGDIHLILDTQNFTFKV